VDAQDGARGHVTELIVQKPLGTDQGTVRGGAPGLVIAGGLALGRGGDTGQRRGPLETDAGLVAGLKTEPPDKVHAEVTVTKFILVAKKS